MYPVRKLPAGRLGFLFFPKGVLAGVALLVDYVLHLFSLYYVIVVGEKGGFGGEIVDFLLFLDDFVS